MTTKKISALAIVASIVSLTLLSLTRAEPGKRKELVGGPDPTTVNSEVNTPAAGARQILGTYVGDFGAHKITVCLQNLIGQTVNGYSIVAGNERAFSGSLVENPRAFEVHVREPGDHAEDGAFVFEYRPLVKRLTGTWTPNNKRLQAKTFDLARRDFRYDPKAGLYPQSSTRALKTADVENLRPEQLRIMRNEIYARHGYSFRLKDMRAHFDTQSWYMPISVNVLTVLTPTEQKNETLIKRYENYGAEYYDAFGR